METVVIKTKNGPVTINKCDYVDGTHTLYKPAVKKVIKKAVKAK
jgi:hypothetical protein